MRTLDLILAAAGALIITFAPIAAARLSLAHDGAQCVTDAECAATPQCLVDAACDGGPVPAGER